MNSAFRVEISQKKAEPHYLHINRMCVYSINIAVKKEEKMRSRIYVAKISLIIVYLFSSLHPVFANRVDMKTRMLIFARRGQDDDGHSHGNNGHRQHKYYKNYHYYPHDYYYYKKIYYFPFKRYYYYYDLYPEKIYYYGDEKGLVAANPNYLPVTSIANMASQGVPDAVIIAEIERTHSVYELNSEIIAYLKQDGVSDRVIDFMLGINSK